jgi:hypothetical protein
VSVGERETLGEPEKLRLPVPVMDSVSVGVMLRLCEEDTDWLLVMVMVAEPELLPEGQLLPVCEVEGEEVPEGELVGVAAAAARGCAASASSARAAGGAPSRGGAAAEAARASAVERWRGARSRAHSSARARARAREAQPLRWACGGGMAGGQTRTSPGGGREKKNVRRGREGPCGKPRSSSGPWSVGVTQ